MGNAPHAKADVLSGVADMRYISLDKLAREAGGVVSDGLKHVLPVDASKRVSVAKFGSCI